MNMVKILCTHVCKWKKMRPVETIPGIGKGSTKRMMEEVNSTMIYWKNFCKCHNAHPVPQ
jgi:hypothetical protein